LWGQPSDVRVHHLCVGVRHVVSTLQVHPAVGRRVVAVGNVGGSRHRRLKHHGTTLGFNNNINNKITDKTDKTRDNTHIIKIVLKKEVAEVNRYQRPQIHFFGKISLRKRNSNLKKYKYHNMLNK